MTSHGVRAPELVGRGWLNTGGRRLRLSDLRGKVVVLDFWTFCCVNCLHVLDELRELETRFADVLVVVGVHSPKFAHEADPDALAAAVARNELRHPVLDDPTLRTWQAYAARAWPTLVVIDPEGFVVAHLAGEGHGPALAALVARLADEHAAKGTLRRGDGWQAPPEPGSEPGVLRFPAKAVLAPNGNLLVADAGHHSLAELAPDGSTLVRRIGSGVRGWVDGPPDEARFAEPNGLALMPPELSGWDYDVVVADTANHLLRGVRLADGAVTTLAGTGEQYVVGGPDNVLRRDGAPSPAALGGEVRSGGNLSASSAVPRLGTPRSSDARWYHGAARRVRLSSPWDVVWYQPWAAFAVAMAGNHSLWAFDPHEGSITHVMGTMNEGLVDGPAGNGWTGPAIAGPELAPRPGNPAAGRGDGASAEQPAWFAQPSGLAVDRGGPGGRWRLWVADAETSALRVVTGTFATARVDTVVGTGLFDFGHRDGPAAAARLQHPLGAAALPDGSVLIADTYNGAVRRWTPPAQAGAPDGGTSVTPGDADVPHRTPDAERVDMESPDVRKAARHEAGAVAPATGAAAPAGGAVTTVAEGLAEPSGFVVTSGDVLVVESAAHRITRLGVPPAGSSEPSPASPSATVVNRGARRTARPVTELAPGDVELVVPFTPAPGQKSDERYGPSTWLSVSSSPPELLASGGGDAAALARRLRLNPDVAEGVLHVSARAAACDDDPAVRFPACHLAAQDWGVPVRLTPGAPTTLTLPLLG